MGKAQKLNAIRVICDGCGARLMVDAKTGEVEAFAASGGGGSTPKPSDESKPPESGDSTADVDDAGDDDDDAFTLGNW